GLRDAYMARVPVIALAGGRLKETRYRAPYQELEDIGTFDHVTKFNATVETIDRLPDMLRQAIREVTSGCPAPAHLELGGLLGNMTFEELEDDNIIEPRFSQTPSFRPSAEPEDIANIVNELSAAQRPVIVAGGGIKSSGAQAELVEFAQKRQIPVATSMNAKGAIPENDPLSVGVVGQYSRECANRVVEEADLVFYIGSMTGGQVTNHWQSPAIGKKVIQADIDPHWLGRNYPNVASACGDAKAVLGQLLVASEKSHGNPEWLQRTREIVGDWEQHFEAYRSSDATPVRPERILREVSNYLPDDAIFVCDTGHAGMWSAQFVELTSPNQKFLRAAGSLGWGFPAALGAKCGCPDRPVFAFTGDGGFYYHLTELETAKRHGINTVTIVNNNEGLNQETPLWERPEGDESLFHHWRFEGINFAKIAQEMGCFGIRVTDPSKIAEALDQAVASHLPAVVEIMSDVKAMAPSAWAPEVAGPGGYAVNPLDVEVDNEV
ncbi:MAG: thiamine pyrophosphate-binding protein, partial [Pseudomonadales bacterium]